MSFSEIQAAVEGLSVAEQEQLLNRLAAKLRDGTEGQFPVRTDHLQLLDERFAAYRNDPALASTWEEVKQRFEARRN